MAVLTAVLLLLSICLCRRPGLIRTSHPLPTLTTPFHPTDNKYGVRWEWELEGHEELGWRSGVLGRDGKSFRSVINKPDLFSNGNSYSFHVPFFIFLIKLRIFMVGV
jgi:hypothetical protein